MRKRVYNTFAKRPKEYEPLEGSKLMVYEAIERTPAVSLGPTFKWISERFYDSRREAARNCVNELKDRGLIEARGNRYYAVKRAETS